MPVVRQRCDPSFTQHGHRWLWVPDRVRCAHLSGTTWVLYPSSRFHFQTANSKHASAISRRDGPEFCKTVSPLLTIEGAGNAGRAMRPQPRVRNKKAHERSHHGHTGNHPAFPAQWFYGLLRALPGDQALLSPSPALLLADLTPTLGRQNHTTSPYASASFVRLAIARLTPQRPPHPVPNVRDDRETPLCGPGRERICI